MRKLRVSDLRSHTNQAAQLQKMARGLELSSRGVVPIYLAKKNKGADLPGNDLRRNRAADLRLCFHNYAKSSFRLLALN